MNRLEATLPGPQKDSRRIQVDFSASPGSEEILLSDARGMIQFVNPCFQESSGFSGQRIVGESIRLFKDRQSQYYNALCQVMENKRPWRGRLVNGRENRAEQIYDISITPIIGHGDLSFLSLRRDVTSQEKKENQVHQAQKMAAIGTLAGGIAHDFNNILAGIIGYSELIKEDIEALDRVSPRTHTRLDNMITAAMRAKKLIHQILTFSRSGREVKHPVSVRFLVKEVVALLRASLPSNIEIQLNLESDAQVLAEPTQIHQIMMNLCSNAKDAMLDQGGILSVSLKDTIVDGELLDDTGLPVKGEFVLLQVKDTGPGIDPSILHMICSPFFTTKPMEKGTGMGLSVVHGIVKGLGGILDIRENNPQGALFNVYLPFCGRSLNKPEGQEKSELISGKNELILFVDDESDLISIAGDGLTNLGYRVKGFDRSHNALDWFLSCPDDVDLVVADITMPGMTGDMLVRKMQELRPDLPFLFITGASERMDEVQAREMGARGLLYKPMILGEMAGAIRRALDKGEVWQEF